ncbi:hypothetical protein RRG08_002043 [Elysia crispata]|uniref:Uncharacterized protein n=1 Tax=Elysia crispata TaxID=231223 RepID=A0AAE0ZK80_9GAST|nr:hypothetical protein RRG08_002043 [Elysia crispata]
MNAAPPQLAQFSTVAKATPSLAGMAIRKQESCEEVEIHPQLVQQSCAAVSTSSASNSTSFAVASTSCAAASTSSAHLLWRPSYLLRSSSAMALNSSNVASPPKDRN